MSETIDFNKFKKDLSKRAQELKWEEKINTVKQMAKDHPEAAAAVGAAGLGALGYLGKTLVKGIANSHKRHQQEKADKAKQMRYYDPSLKKWWTLRRPLNNDDLAEIQKRRNRGESLATILRTMNVL